MLVWHHFLSCTGKHHSVQLKNYIFIFPRGIRACRVYAHYVSINRLDQSMTSIRLQKRLLMIFFPDIELFNDLT